MESDWVPQLAVWWVPQKAVRLGRRMEGTLAARMGPGWVQWLGPVLVLGRVHGRGVPKAGKSGDSTVQLKGVHWAFPKGATKAAARA